MYDSSDFKALLWALALAGVVGGMVLILVVEWLVKHLRIGWQ